MRNLIALLTALSIAVLVAAGCGSGEEEAASGASELVPAGALMYGEATLDPEGDQQEAIDALLSKFPGGDEALAKLREQLDESLRDSDAGLSFSEDIDPWLGDQAAFYVGSLGGEGGVEDAVVLLASEDDEQAEAALEKTADGEPRRKTHNDVEYMVDDENAAVVTDGYVAIGPEQSIVRVIDMSKGGDESLADDDRYAETIDEAAEDRVGLFYMNSPALLEAVQEMGGPVPPGFGAFFEAPMVVTLAAEEDGVTLESTVQQGGGAASPFGEGSDLLEELPADSWAAFSVAELGPVLDETLDSMAAAIGGRDMVEQQLRAATGLDLDEDVLAWMGDLAAFARGESLAELDGALMVTTDDEDATGRFIAALRRLGESQAVQGAARVTPLSAPGGGDGFSVVSSAIPQPIHVFQRGGRFVIAYGDAAATDATDAGERLGDSSEYQEARDSLGDYKVAAYVLLGPVLDLVESTPAGSEEDWQEAKPYLEPLSALVMGTSGDDDETRSAVKIIVK